MSDLSYLAPSDTPREDVLRELGKKVHDLLEKRKEIAFAEEKLKELSKQEAELSREEIPQIILSRGLSSVRLDTGEKVEVIEHLAASVPKDEVKRKVVFAWLVQNQGAYLIKQELVVEDPEQELVDYLRKKEIPFTKGLSMNTNSFQAFLRAGLGMKKGTLQTLEIGEIPKEANPFVYKETKISI